MIARAWRARPAPRTPVFSPEDDRYLVEREPAVQHLEVDVHVPE